MSGGLLGHQRGARKDGWQRQVECPASDTGCVVNIHCAISSFVDFSIKNDLIAFCRYQRVEIAGSESFVRAETAEIRESTFESVTL